MAYRHISLMSIPAAAIDLFVSGGSAQDAVLEQIMSSKSGHVVSLRTAQEWFKVWSEAGKPAADERSPKPAEDDDVKLMASVFRLIKDKPTRLGQIANHIDRGPETVLKLIARMQEEGYNVDMLPGQLAQVSTAPGGYFKDPDRVETLADRAGQEFGVGVPSDLHVGSRKQQISALRRFCDIARNEYHITNFIVPGDLTAGFHVYRGQDKEVYALTSDMQERALAVTVPILDSDEWEIMGGNHDWSHVKFGGRDVVYRFCQSRPNIHYLGYSQYDLPLTDRVSMRLWHPRGGVPYAKSYRAQKGIEALIPQILRNSLSDQSVPQSWVLAIGHLHIAHFMPGKEVCAFQAGCFEGQTSWMKEGALDPAIGGWILRFRVADNGLIQRIEPIWIGFDEIEEDWRNYPELVFDTVNPAEQVEPLFEGHKKVDTKAA